MKKNAKNNLGLLTMTALILVGLNAAVWAASDRGMIAAIENVPLWGAFVALNIVSLLWAVSMLGLQPMAIALSYIAGGAVAFVGVRNMSDINMAEVVTAGATYGAFGVLAVGNAATKVRLAFFNRGQVPFALVIAALLVLDGMLNSRISQAETPVLLNAVAYPFVLAGAVPGLFMVMARRSVVQQEAVVEKSAMEEQAVPVAIEPDEEGVEEEPSVAPMPAEADRLEETIEPVAPEVEAPVVAQEETGVTAEIQPPAAEAEEAEFIPFEIAAETTEEEFEEDTLNLLEAVVRAEELAQDEPAPVEEVSVVDEAEPEEALADPAVTSEKVIPLNTDAVAESSKEKDEDWLSGHLDLLKKIG